MSALAPGDNSSVSTMKYQQKGNAPDMRSSRPSMAHPMNDFDQEGLELGKDARVWKVYVKEADRTDEEVVNGWNKSLDLILVFAALFSAISTAFLIESSKKLQKDPVDVTAETLRTISQTLLAISNNSQPSNSINRPVYEDVPYTPPAHAVLVNTLWFLSLSLSLGTSLLAMLAKEWCHSFMANRTGDPYIQARLRQEKWEMIERWKLRELLVLLPSLMHLALLLFAIGLCVYVWDINTTAAVPIICITSGVFAFYVSSSVTAVLVRNFPYTTIVSRITLRFLRSRCFQYIKYMCTICGYIMFLLVWWCVYLACFVIIATLALVLGIFCFPCLPCVFAFICLGVVAPLAFCIPYGPWRKAIEEAKSSPRWKRAKHMAVYFLPMYFPSLAPPIHRKKSETPIQDGTVSRALKWLIQHCEVSNSVDVALQAIAGANASLPLTPLKECQAASQILKRLAMPRLHDKSREKVESLYMRALASLGHNSESTGGLLQVHISKYQSEYEPGVAALITDGEFTADQHNLDALRTGSTSGVTCLRLLKEDPSALTRTLNGAVSLMGRHLDEPGMAIHEAPLFSLVKAVTLFSACNSSSTWVDNLAHTCLRLINHNLDAQKEGIAKIPVLNALVMCTLFQSRSNDERKPTRLVDLAYVEQNVQVLANNPGLPSDAVYASGVVWLGLQEMLSDKSLYNLNNSDNELSILRTLIDLTQGASTKYTSVMLRKFQALEQPWPKKPWIRAQSIGSYLHAISHIYHITLIARPLPAVYVCIVRAMCAFNSLTQQDRQHCLKTLAVCAFPEMSREFIDCLRKEQVLPLLVKSYGSRSLTSHFAATQLWEPIR